MLAKSLQIDWKFRAATIKLLRADWKFRLEVSECHFTTTIGSFDWKLSREVSRATRVYYGSSQQLETIGSLWHAGIHSVRLEVPRAAGGGETVTPVARLEVSECRRLHTVNALAPGVALV